MSKTRDARLEGYAICRAKIKGWIDFKIISTIITVNGTYTPDWQEDAHYWHDEGWYEYDLDEAEPVDVKDYAIIRDNGEVVSGDSEIIKIIEVLSNYLSEVA